MKKTSPLLANILAFSHVDSHVEFNLSDYIAEYHEINLLFAFLGSFIGFATDIQHLNPRGEPTSRLILLQVKLSLLKEMSAQS